MKIIADPTHVARGLREAGHLVYIAREGREGLLKAAAEQFDAIILDRMTARRSNCCRPRPVSRTDSAR